MLISLKSQSLIIEFGDWKFLITIKLKKKQNKFYKLIVWNLIQRQFRGFQIYSKHYEQKKTSCFYIQNIEFGQKIHTILLLFSAKFDKLSRIIRLQYLQSLSLYLYCKILCIKLYSILLVLWETYVINKTLTITNHMGTAHPIIIIMEITGQTGPDFSFKKQQTILSQILLTFLPFGYFYPQQIYFLVFISIMGNVCEGECNKPAHAHLPKGAKDLFKDDKGNGHGNGHGRKRSHSPKSDKSDKGKHKGEGRGRGH